MRQHIHTFARWLLVLAGVQVGSSLMAEVSLPAVFSDHAVLQQEKVTPIWGWAAAGEKVTVSIGGQSQSTVGGADGRWKIQMELLPSSQPVEMIVEGSNKLVIKDVLIGEVWLCAGQSNMVMTVAESKDYDLERKNASLPQIRMFTVLSGRAETKQEDCAASWVICTPESVGDFSAVGFFAARELNQTLQRPVGILNSSAGGTLIESWLDLETQKQCVELKAFFAQRERLMAEFDRDKAAAAYKVAMTKWKLAAEAAKAANHPPPRQPSDPYGSFLGAMNVGGLFNGKIAPLIPYAVRGIAWYQGESNAHPDRVPFYETQMRLLVTDWRSRWGEELPFVWVQLPNLAKKMPWAEIREAQLRCLDLPKTGMIVSIDAGESRDIHPKDKQTIGHRLAQWALGGVYQKEVAAVSGPIFERHEMRGREIVLHFRHANGGLKATSGELKGFIMAGENKAWKPAVARIEGNTVIVHSPQITKPVAVRYAWASDPVCNLFNHAGLPASPFRTDSW